MYIYIHLRGAAKQKKQSTYMYQNKTKSTKQHTVSFHNFKSQKIKLGVSNPKNKYVAYLSVLSQISNLPGSRPQKQTLNFDN